MRRGRDGALLLRRGRSAPKKFVIGQGRMEVTMVWMMEFE